MAETFESLIVATDICAMVTILPFAPFQIMHGINDRFALMYYTILIEICIVYAMFVFIVLKWLIEFNESTIASINSVLFTENFGLSYIALYLFYVSLVLILVSQIFEILVPFLIFQIPFVEADILLSEQTAFKKRHTLPILIAAIILLPVVGNREIENRLVEDTNCVETLKALIDFHKFTSLGVLLTAMGLAMLKKRLVLEILFPTDTPESKVKVFGDCAICFPVVVFWMIIVTSMCCGLNLWFPMLMRQLIHDAGSLLIDNISHWHLEAQDPAEEQNQS